MIDRRTLVAGAAGLAGAAALWETFDYYRGAESYEHAAKASRLVLRASGGAKELIRYATLAANSHNSQPWRFTLDERRIVIAPDFARRLPVVDPSDHHLFVSLGCAAENLVLAAAATGLRATPELAGDAIGVALEPAPVEHSALFHAIPQRQSTRALYDGKPAASEALRLLDQAGAATGVALVMITDPKGIADVVDYVLAGDSFQMRDRAYLDELQSWMRFSPKDAAATSDGLFSRASGNPGLPGWLARPLLPLVFTESGERDKHRAQIQSSAGVAVFVAERDDRPHWVQAGRACQRFALQATALGLKCAFINQPVEAPEVRRQFASHLGVGDRLPDLVLRFGAGPVLPMSLRRPVNDVLA